jgi:hypothetical protein
MESRALALQLCHRAVKGLYFLGDFVSGSSAVQSKFLETFNYTDVSLFACLWQPQACVRVLI